MGNGRQALRSNQIRAPKRAGGFVVPKIARAPRGEANRKHLLLSTALASTFLLAGTATQAQVTCIGQGGPNIRLVSPATIPDNNSISCINTSPRDGTGVTGNAAINLQTGGNTSVPIFLDSEGELRSYGVGRRYGIRAVTDSSGANSTITIENRSDIDRVVSTGPAGADPSAAYGIYSRTRNVGGDIEITSSGDADVEAEETATGIFALGARSSSEVHITNTGEIHAVAVSGAYGIDTAPKYNFADVTNNRVKIENHESITVEAGDNAIGIRAHAGSGFMNFGIYADDSPVHVTNSADITAEATGTTDSVGTGIQAFSIGDRSPVSVDNSGSFVVVGGDARGVSAFSTGTNSNVNVVNTGDLTVRSIGTDIGFGDAVGISASAINDSTVTIQNSGGIDVAGLRILYGIGASNINFGYPTKGPISVINSGDISIRGIGAIAGGTGISIRSSQNTAVEIDNTATIDVSAASNAFGISVTTVGNNTPVTIDNTGDIRARTTTAGSLGIARGIDVLSDGTDSPIAINNSGAIDVFRTTTAMPGSGAQGILAIGYQDDSGVSVVNRGDVDVRVGGTGTGVAATGILAGTRANGAINVVNSGSIYVAGGYINSGIVAAPAGASSPVSITNSGSVHAAGGDVNSGIIASATGPDSPIGINNSGSVFATGGYRNVGIYANSTYANKTTITNTGDVSSESYLAIDVKGAGTANIYNAGLITGFVDLTDQNDLFVNRSGGVFETKQTSFFRGGNDLFVNEAGGTVQAATDRRTRETNGFEGLETFRNAGGTISLVDGGVGDRFTISNTPGAANLKFDGGGFLAVDAALRGPGSKADTFIVDGNVSGRTKVLVNNTSTLPGAFNNEGIPIVFVDGNTPREGNFVLANGPIDTGLFDYDLFFVPTGSGFWELRSFVGGTAHALPKLLTAAQDLWHESASTWFDRTADLRVILNGGFAAGGAPAYDAGTKSLGAPGSNGLTPGVWIKGGGGQLDRDASAKTSAFGRTYTYDLDNELTTFDLQVGVDMGRYDVIAQGDVLIFGVLGGFIGANLDYGNTLADTFGFSGGQVGAYATYLNGGLFVDTLLNVHLYEIDAPNLGFPDSLDGSTVGLRTDAGYRFGSFSGGAFFEPLATIEVMWADIDGFNVAGNAVSFSDDANVRGRIGGRVGTTTQAWEGTMMEPFVIASLWGNLSEDNSARLVSSGTTFRFQDDLQDVWGEVSAGVNLFNFTQTTAVFAKVDYTFGEDIQGIGGKGGVRVAW